MPASRLRVSGREQRIDEGICVERGEVVDAFAEADVADRHAELGADRKD
jgi:hypothetical protein